MMNLFFFRLSRIIAPSVLHGILVLSLLFMIGCESSDNSIQDDISPDISPIAIDRSNCVMKYSVSRDRGLFIHSEMAGQGENDKLEEAEQGYVPFYMPVSEAKNYFLGGIQPADATRIKRGDKQVLGVLKNKEVQPRELLQALLHEEKIGTYWHLDADLCLISEENDVDFYKAFLAGEHHYCTNDCYDEEFAFAFIIDWNSQKVLIQGS